MLTPLILFLGLTVATAVIAHWSDNLGKKLGKKRVSLFGLRPRTTATILTVASSWGIMLFTLAALLITHAPLKNALFTYDEERAKAQGDREQAKREIEAARQRLEATQQQVTDANAQFKTAETQLKHAGIELQKANRAVKTSQKDAKDAEKQGKQRAEAAKKEADIAIARADEAQNRFVEAQNRVVTAQNRLVTARNSLNLAQNREKSARNRETIALGETTKAKSQTGIAQRQTQIAQRDAENAQTRAEKARGLTQKAQEDLRGARQNLRAARESLRLTKVSLQDIIATRKKAGDEAFRAQGEVFVIERQVKQLRKERELLENLAKETLSNDAPVKINQVFAARIIDPNQSADAIAAQLREMLEQAQNAFRKEEEELPEPRFSPDTSVQLLPLPVPDASGNPLILEGQSVLSYWARDIVKEGQPTSARLVAPRNFLATEALIELRFAFVPIASAFREGEILASLTIDGAQGDALIFNSLLELTNLGRRRAEERGVNPPESPAQPNFYASDTNVRLFEALRLIERSKKRLRINLVAAKALTTVEPLRVRFEIETGSSVPTS